MNHKKLFALFALIAMAVLFLLSCGERFDEDEDPSLSEIIAIGKRYLMTNRGAQAAEAFKAAKEKCDASVDATYGLMLAHTMQLMNLVDEVSKLASSLFQTAPEPPAGAGGDVQVQAQSAPIGDFLQEFITDTLEKDYAENESLFQELEPGEDFSFEIDPYRVIIGGNTVVSMKGEQDKTDLYFFGATVSLINAVIDLVQAHDLNFNLDALALPDFATADTWEIVMGISDLIESLLTDPEYPDFLKVKGQDGLNRVEAMGINLGLTFERVGQMFDQLATETDYQFDDQIRYYDINKNNQYDEMVDPVALVDLLTLDPGLAPIIRDLGYNLSLVFWEGSSFDPNPHKVDTLNLAQFNDILVYLGVLGSPILPEFIGINVGEVFSNPTNDGLRTLLLFFVDLINIVDGFVQSQPV